MVLIMKSFALTGRICGAIHTQGAGATTCHLCPGLWSCWPFRPCIFDRKVRQYFYALGYDLVGLSGLFAALYSRCVPTIYGVYGEARGGQQ